ncbi:class I SAM-dependent methyltransferase [Novosphingobium sp. M1R2S20]|uniref:Class I SAM-dependent methyltransferase n=1 Tax=Novosphingobium rhizovicinum TaxID=3228928 RepID=A0ABV3R9V1_9SPHN
MADLLIHSMSEFADIIVDCLDIAEASRIVEIGAEFGGMSQVLADFAGRHGGKLVSIDPAPKAEFLDWVQGSAQVEHIPLKSLEAVPHLSNVQAWVIDGDHNYYTVYHEVKAIDAVCRRDGMPLLAFFHDVSWPCARRDQYYAPREIPVEWRHPYDYDAGAHVDSEVLLPGRGFRGMGHFAYAIRSGGPRNGVLTAIEDAIGEFQGEGRQLAWAHVPAVFGLGILFDMDAPWAAQIAARVAPLHNNPLVRTLEENRLRNYLRVIDLQDELAALHSV